MRIAQINITAGVGSTGKICIGISNLLNEKRIENYILYSKDSCKEFNAICYSNVYIRKLEALKSRVFGNYGFNSKCLTKRLITELNKIKPDIIHLHNLHGHNCNLKMLFEYIKKNHIRVVWTFHDCWAFTAYCPYFSLVKCEKWRDGCNNCLQYKTYSWFFDRSEYLYNKKKQVMQDVEMEIVTPSQWLADLVSQSFLKEYPVRVINNGIDLSVFKPTASDFRKRYRCEDKYIVLGVAFGWGKRKGLDVFAELSKRLGDRYQVVLVGTDAKVDQQLPENIISIHRTQNQQELAEIYTAADVFANPTREENYPTVDMEALACGTPVITFMTGGSPEIIDETCGIVVPCDDVDAMECEIRNACEKKLFSSEVCTERAKAFDMDERFAEYIKLYHEAIE